MTTITPRDQGNPDDLEVAEPVADSLARTQLAPPLLHSTRVAPGLSLTGRSALAAQSLTETLTEAARAAMAVSEWERDQEAWNLPRAHGGTIAPDVEKAEADVAEGDREQRQDPPPIPPAPTQ